MARSILLCFLFVTLVKLGFAISALPTHNIFYAPGNNGLQPYIELYWQVNPNTVQFTQNDKKHWIGKIKTELIVRCDTGIIASEKYYLQTTPALSIQAATLQNIMDLHRISIPNNKIVYTLTLTDENNSSSTFTYRDSIEVADNNNCFFSDIQIVDTTYKTNISDNIFYKNGRLHIPSCINFLDEHKKFLHTYSEIYNTDKVNDSLYPLVREISISKKAFDPAIYKLSTTDTITKSQSVIPNLSSLKIDVLPSGNYHTNIILKGKNGHIIAKKSAFFQRSNPKPIVVKDTTAKGNDSIKWEKVNVFDLGKTFVSKYNTAQLKAILKMMLPISTKVEEANIEIFIEEPDDTHMRYFIYNFWNARQAGSAEKEWERYTKKVKEVNRLFGSSVKGGYETDRGFFYLKYGEPNQRITVSNEQGAHPYEVWIYNAPGRQSSQGVLLFYSPSFMINDYELLHTTIMGEIRNTTWRSFLYKSGQSSNNLNSRAEQIIGNR